MSDQYESLRLRNQLCFPIYLCAKEITRRYAPLLERIDLTYTQYIVMMYFWEFEGGTARDLSHRLLLDPSTLTPVLKKLEQKGFIARRRSDEDERSVRITLTDAGRALQDKALCVPAQMGKCLDLTEDEARTMGAIVMKILNNIEKEL